MSGVWEYTILEKSLNLLLSEVKDNEDKLNTKIRNLEWENYSLKSRIEKLEKIIFDKNNKIEEGKLPWQ